MSRFSLKTALMAGIILAAVAVLAALPARAADTWLDRAKQGGLNTVGSEVYGQDGAPSRPIQGIVTTLIRLILGFVGVIFVVMIIVAGFQYMTAGGNEETVKQAVARIRNCVIGLVIVLCAYSITYFITSRALPAITNGS